MISNALIEEITRQAAIHFPQEACGFILADATVIPCPNISPTPQHSFLIDPLLFTQYDARILAVYHSHPNAAPTPSPADIASAHRCNLPFIILSYPGGDIHTYYPAHRPPLPYLGRPFVYGVLDCLNLVADYYQREHGIDLQDGERKPWDWWTEPENQHALINGFKSRGFFCVDTPQPHDILVMSLLGSVPNHVAIYRGQNIILHHPGQGNLSREEMYGHYWQQRTQCILRHPKIAHETNPPIR